MAPLARAGAAREAKRQRRRSQAQRELGAAVPDYAPLVLGARSCAPGSRPEAGLKPLESGLEASLEAGRRPAGGGQRQVPIPQAKA